MATAQDVETQRQAVITQLENLIADAQDHGNSATAATEQAHWQAIEDALQKQLEVVELQNFEADQGAAQSAFDALQTLTGELNDVAGHMKTATDFMNKLADVVGAVNTAVGAMKK